MIIKSSRLGLVTVWKVLFQIKVLNSQTCSVIIVQKKKSPRHKGRHPWLSFALTWRISTLGIRVAEECQCHHTLIHRFTTTYSITSTLTIQWWCHNRKAAMATLAATVPSSMRQPCTKWCMTCTTLAARPKSNKKRMSAHHLKRKAAKSKTPIYEWQKWILLSRHSLANKK